MERRKYNLYEEKIEYEFGQASQYRYYVSHIPSRLEDTIILEDLDTAQNPIRFSIGVCIVKKEHHKKFELGLPTIIKLHDEFDVCSRLYSVIHHSTEDIWKVAKNDYGRGWRKIYSLQYLAVRGEDL